MKKKYVEIILVTILFMFSFYLWSLPYQKNMMPYGDVDSSTHFTIADYMALSNYPTYWLPYYIGYITEGAGKLWYPPQYHTTSAILSIFTGERILPVLLFQTLACFSIIFTSYFLIRKLYGMLPAFLASLLLVFSIRDIMWYLWGQYPQVLSFGIIPLVLYCFYRYLIENKKIYLYLVAMLTSVQFFIHPQAIFISFVTCAFFTFFFIIKNKKFPFKVTHIVIALIILILLIAPFYSFPFGTKTGYSQGISGVKIDTKRFGTLLHWYGILEPIGVPKDYYSFSKMIGLWVLPLFLLGLGILIMRRENKDLLLISWLIAFYIAAHDTVFGLWRAERFTETEIHVLAPIAVIGLLSIYSFIKIKNEYKMYLKYGLAIIFIVFAFSFNGAAAYKLLNNAYSSIYRITPAQYDVAEWMRKNIPETADVYEFGTYMLTKKKWIRAISLTHETWDGDSILPKRNATISDYVMIDYSDIIAAGDKGNFDELQAWEKSNLADSKLVYDKYYIKVYKVGKS